MRLDALALDHVGNETLPAELLGDDTQLARRVETGQVAVGIAFGKAPILGLLDRSTEVRAVRNDVQDVVRRTVEDPSNFHHVTPPRVPDTLQNRNATAHGR